MPCVAPAAVPSGAEPGECLHSEKPENEIADPLWIELHDERRVPGLVGEEDRDMAPAGPVRSRKLGQPLPHRPERRLDNCVAEVRAALVECHNGAFELIELHPIDTALHARSLRRGIGPQQTRVTRAPARAD